jgi:uncharacterized protein YecT (DUF1311 family)
MRTLLLALAVGLIAARAVAADAPDPVEKRYSPAYQKCLDSPDGQSTMGMVGCNNDEAAVQDKALNAAYRKAMKDLTAEQKTKLQAAQRAWIAFRDAECASYQDNDWGSISNINAAACLLRMTVQRTMDLENYPPAT